MDPFSAELARLEEANLLRRLRALDVVGPTRGRLDGRDVVLFSTNDYLGLSAHPLVRERAAAAAAEGMGPRGSALLCGWSRLHEELSTRLAAFFRAEACFLFPTGYLANLGVFQTLGRFGGTVLSDERNHASLIDGCRLSRLDVRVYRHLDVGHLEELVRDAPPPRTIVSDALFSMDGDPAPVLEIARIAERYDARVLLDEAHAFLVYGPEGRGVGAAILGPRLIRVGTLSKAFGSLGGFVLGPRPFVDLVVNLGRTGLFSTALPVPVVAAALAALDVVERDGALRERLWSNVRLAADLFPRGVGASSPIVPVILGTEERALAAAAALLDAGLHVPAVRPPTVPAGTSRLRVTLTAAHAEAEVRSLASALRLAVGTGLG
ncbi:MAG: pyridoxal phosphate-dependent aminotransferase family protein [Planctomycetota bacterium]